MLLSKQAFTLTCGLMLSFTAMVSHADTADRGHFSDYVAQLKQEAVEQGVSTQIIDDVFPKIKMFKKAVASDKAQPETKLTLETYLPRVVPDWKVDKARNLFKTHQVELERIGQLYGVQPRFIVALWGVESNFGKLTGNYPVLSVTASLAYEGRREAFFKKEFFAALKIAEQEQFSFEEMKGSWAGAMGQTQFMPTSFLAYAQDGDGDGKKDIWNNASDAFASAAYYLQQAGWKESETWGRQVKVPDTFDHTLADLAVKKTFSQWQALGVRRFNGSDLPNRDDMMISMVMPDGAKGRKYLVYDNYRGLLRWNKSNYFAISVTYLSERIKYPPIS
ncbi:lytic murein transglycosylase [Shewanella gelidimarina]|uniref:lytic murein transglycosylase n=1 Tax=Shewanella gelidimarina TaxID=56813 RepID=UPI0020109908|nr:lytic murein transglycosylase [Shewanella gelidimarina]MCL1058714.1 lytic murein transglycosylase [Shewanella gelidimarina]